MSAKKAASKKKTRPSSKKSVVKKAKPKLAARSGKSSSRKTIQKPSSKKTVKSAKSTSHKKVSKHETPTHKGHNKEVAKPAASVAKKAPTPPSPISHHVAIRPAMPIKRRSSANLLSGPVRGFTPYQPKRGEEYMNKDQLEHFRQLLLAWKRELMEEVDRTMLHMKDDAANFPDPNDRATQESEFGLELRTRDRERKLLKKVQQSLARIESGEYGWCEETGEPIGIPRLLARPTATLSLEAQERRELRQKLFGD